MISKEYIMDPIKITNEIKDEKLVGNWGNIKYFFHIYRNRNFKKNANLISCNFFMLKQIDKIYANQKKVSLEQFKKEHKKKVRMYLAGIDKLLNYAAKDIKFTIRIYCDITTIEYLQKYLKNDNIELFMYFFPQFFKETHHIGFFGTFIRYLPLFKLKNHNDREWNTTTILDIDLEFKNEFRLINYYLKNIKKLPNLMFKTRPCYFIDPRLSFFNMKPQFFRIISSFFIQKNPQEFSIMHNFMEELLEDHFNNYNRVLELYLGHNIKKREFKGRLEYGVDEYFLNKIFFQQLYLNKNKPFAEVFIGNYQLSGIISWLYYLQETNSKIKNEKILEQFLQVIASLLLENYQIKPYNNIQEFINNLSDTLYEKNIHKKRISNKNYQKIIDICKKIGEKHLNMPDGMLVCLERSMNLSPDKITVVRIEPGLEYHEYKEKVIDYIKF